MKKTIFKILSLALTVGLLASLIVGTVPAGANVSVTSASASPSTISATSTVTIKFTATANLTTPAGKVAGLTLTNGGFGYFNAPTVTIASPTTGVQATATATVANGVVTGLTITDPGSGYTSAPAVTIDPSGYTPVTATASAVSISGGVITGITVDNPTANGYYTSPPTVTIVDTTGIGANATAVLTNGRVTSVIINNGGSGYTAPTATFSAPPTTAAVTATATAVLEAGVADTITATFPTSFDVDSVSATFSNGVDPAAPANLNLVKSNPVAGILVFDVPVNATVGYVWTLTISNVGNPAMSGSYPVTVATSKEPAPQTANINIGQINKVVVYNAAGQYMGTESFLSDVVLGFGYTVEIYAGTYAGPSNNLTINAPKVTVKGMGGAVILGDIVVNGGESTVSDLVVIGGGFVVNGDEVTVKNIVFNKTAPPGAVGPETLLAVYGDDVTVMDCNFDLTSPAGISDVGIDISGADRALVTGCSFKVDQTVGWVEDRAIESAASEDLAVEFNTFTGSSGYGVYIGNDDSFEIIANTFTGLEVGVYVLEVDNTSVIAGNTFTGGTVNGMEFYNAAAIYVNDVDDDQLWITNNEIHDNASYSVYVDDFCCDWDHPFINGNNFANNAKGLFNGKESQPLNAVGNYWGGWEGPGVGDADDVTGNVTTEPFISVPNTGAFAYLADVAGPNSPDTAKNIAGFGIKNYGWDDGLGLVVGQTLSGNPAPMAPPFPALAYFDVYTSSPTNDDMTVSLYCDCLTNASNVYYWSGIMSGWVLASDQGVAGSGAYAWFKVAPAGSPNLLGNETAPAPDELTGTYFVIVDGIAPPSETIVPSGPAAGATTALCSIPFAWPTVPGATGYKIVIWTTDINSPIVSESVTSPSYMSGCLDAGSYFWKVYAMQGDNVLSESAANSFVTQAPPTTTTAPPPVTITTQPPATITITQPPASTITFQPPAEENITPVWIYVIIAIGAVLVIVVIVLIIRTRRTT